MARVSARFVKFCCAVVVGLVVSRGETARAGWSGLMNGVGKGWAGVDVGSSTLHTNRAITITNLSLPSAANPPTTGYKTNAPLPSGASAGTYARIKGLSGGVWQASLHPLNGDHTGNPELENRVTIIGAPCSSLNVDTLIAQSWSETSSHGGSGQIIGNVAATEGTALWLRGFEFNGSMADVPPDDPDTVQNESIEYIKAHGGEVRFDTLILGPFEFGVSNTCPLIIPFTLRSGDLEKFIFATDGAAKSTPLEIFCPTGIVAQCTDRVYYPDISYSGCGNVAVTFDPPLPAAGYFSPGAFLVGDTTVKVTVTDDAGDTANCTFTVTVTDGSPPARPTLPDIIVNGCGGVSYTPPRPTTTDNCSGTITGTTTNQFPITTFGTNLVTWTFDDGNGNQTTATQRIIVTGLKFTGFYSPISAINGSCAAPARS